jgi:hypothetical protein
VVVNLSALRCKPGAALALTKMNTEIDVRDVLKNIRVPALVLHRTGDRCLHVDEGRYVASLIPGSRFVEVPGDDHLPFVGDQDSILDQLEEFLIGARPLQYGDRVLATVLFARFLKDEPGSLNPVVFDPDTNPMLSADLKREIQRFRGRLISAKGESLLALFDGPARAVRCACSIAEHASWLNLSVAESLHTGECNCSDQANPSGVAIEVAAQVLDSACPGEVVVSSTVRDLVAGSGIQFEERDCLYVAGVCEGLRSFRVITDCPVN